MNYRKLAKEWVNSRIAAPFECSNEDMEHFVGIISDAIEYGHKLKDNEDRNKV